jgi:hypothetical protein
MCDEYLASFESQLVNLTAVSSNLNRKIEFNSRFKDAVGLLHFFLCQICTDVRFSSQQYSRYEMVARH